jgi:hypothetical protein
MKRPAPRARRPAIAPARRPAHARTLRAAFGLAAALALTPALPSSPAFAQTQDEINEARSSAKDGLAAYKAGDFKKALVLFDAARKLYPSAQILRMTGYSYLALEEWAKAADLMDLALASSVGPLDNDDKKDVAEQLTKATSHLGEIAVTSDVAGAELTIDQRAPMKLPLDKPVRLLAGKHTLTVRAPEHTDATRDVTIEGGARPVDIKLSPVPIPKKVEPPPPPPPKPKPPPPPPKGWIPMQLAIGLAAGSVGVVLGAGAITTGAGSLHLQGQVQNDKDLHTKNYGQACDNPALYSQCMFDRQVVNYDADRANTLANVSLATGIAGGVLLAGGVVLVLFAPEGPLGPKPAPPPKDGSLPRKPTSSLSAACAPIPTGGVTCSGTF